MKFKQSRRYLGSRALSLASVTLAVVAAMSCATPLEKAYAQPMRGSAGAYEVEVLVDGAPAPRFFHAGESYVMGQMGQRYTLRVWNRSGRRIEAVVSVDGRDVIDGKQGDFRNKRGYLVAAWGSVDIDGWRLSEHQAAAFRFTSVPNSYAGRMGNARNVGVIGVAVFPERVYAPRPYRPIYPQTPPPPGYYPEPYSSRDRAEESGAPSNKSAPSQSGRGAGSDDAIASAPPPSAPMERRPSSPHRPGLGTEFGESMSSHVREVSFTRANAYTPALVLGLRYNDRAGLLALGIDVDGPYYGHQYDDQWLRGTAEPFPVSHRRYATPPAGWQR